MCRTSHLGLFQPCDWPNIRICYFHVFSHLDSNYRIRPEMHKHSAIYLFVYIGNVPIFLRKPICMNKDYLFIYLKKCFCEVWSVNINSVLVLFYREVIPNSDPSRVHCPWITLPIITPLLENKFLICHFMEPICFPSVRVCHISYVYYGVPWESTCWWVPWASWLLFV